MAANNARGPSAAITGINVTPLVDITLVLLIIFMVTAKLIVRHDALLVELPKATNSEGAQQIFSVTLTVDGRTQVNGEAAASDEDIVPSARKELAADKDLRAVIQADGRVEHRRVMHVLDLLKEAGVARIAFAVIPDAAKPSSLPGRP